MSSFARRIRAAVVSVGLMPATALAASPDLAPEDLLFGEIPMVISATRTERSLLDVPNAMTVITASEIHESGATSLEEVLQVVPGLEIMRISNSDVNVSARGFNVHNASTLLVMIDGRSAYRDFFGIVPWASLNVTLDDIERIEVIRGPGSALYGANAYLGIVNIITHSARDLPSLHVESGVGPDTSFVSATGAMTSGRAAIKGSARYDHRDYYRNVTDTAANINRDRHRTDFRNDLVRATFEYDFEDEGGLRLSGGSIDTKAQLFTSVGTFRYEGPEYYLQANLERGPWKLQSFFNRIDFGLLGVPIGVPGVAIGLTDRLVSDTVDIEVQREFSVGSHSLLVGANSRMISTDAPAVLGSREADTLYGLFAQDVFPLSDDLTAFLSFRADQHAKSGLHLSPRAGLVARLGETERLRFSIARSYRVATQIQNYSSLNLWSNIGVPTNVVQVRGNDELDPVFVTSLETGYETVLSPRLKARADLFYNMIDDHQQFAVVTAGLPTVMSFRNHGSTKAYGGELSLEFRLSDAHRGFATYSFQEANGPSTGATPRHKATGGLRGRLAPRLRYALTGTVVGHSGYEVTGSTLSDEIESRAALDGFLGYQLTPHFELGLKGRNLFHQVRQQHPLGDEIGSELLVVGTLEF